MEKITKKIKDERVKTLLNFGLELDEVKKCYQLGAVVVTTEQVENETTGNWAALMESMTEQVANEKIPFAEEIPDAQPAESHEIVLARTIETEVSKLDVNKAKLVALKKKYAKLDVKDLNDKEGYKALKDAKSVVRKVRTTVESKRKEIKEDYLEIGRKIDAAATEYKNDIVAIESIIDAKIEKFDKWKEEAEAKEKQDKADKLEGRVKALIAAGMVFNGSFYAIGDSITQDITSIEGYADDKFQLLLERVQAEKKAIDDAAAQKAIEQEKEEQERKERDEEVKRQQEENDKKSKELEEEQKQIRAERMEMRDGKLVNIGLEWKENTGIYFFKNKYSEVVVTKAAVEGMDKATFDNFIVDNSFIIKTAKSNQEKSDKAEQEKLDRYNNRFKALIELGFVMVGEDFIFAGAELKVDKFTVFNFPIEQWVPIYEDALNQVAQYKEQVKKDEEQKELDRLAAIETFNNRSSDLINIGLRLENNVFTKVDQFNKRLDYTAEKIKSYTAEQWPEILKYITNAVATFDNVTKETVEGIEAAKAAALPDVEKVRGYISALQSVMPPEPQTKEMQDIILSLTRNISISISAAERSIAELKVD